jgi:chemotaxis protein CheZ
MAEPRKVFRIEQMTAMRRQAQTEEAPPSSYTDVMNELAALRAMFAAAPASPGVSADADQQDEIRQLLCELRNIHAAIDRTEEPHVSHRGSRLSPPSAARIPSELKAVVTSSEQAAQKILAAAEDIDQAANNLSAALKDDVAHGLAQDIRDRVIQIFEACNYQDLASQRVTKVIAALGRIERQITRTLKDHALAEAAPPVHGPRLPNDQGHVSQRDVDSLFEADVA